MNALSRRFISLFTAVLALGLALASNPLPALAGSTRVVDDNFGSPGACRGAGYATIQAAADSFSDGQSGAIKICAGVYAESVTIDNKGKIKILGMPGAVITPAAIAPLISATGTSRLTVQGLTLDGTGLLGSSLIWVQNGSALVTKNVFQNAGSSFGVAMSVSSGRRTLKAINNRFTSVSGMVNAFSDGGSISARVTGNNFANGATGVGASTLSGGSVTIVITNNRLQGTGTGIQLNGVNKARVSGNTLDGFDFGVTILDSSRVNVSRNTVRTAQYGITLASGSIDGSSNKLTNNTINLVATNAYGILLQTASGRVLDRTQVKGNAIANAGLYTDQIGISLHSLGGTFNKTKITGNKLTNIATPYIHTGDTNTAIKGNKCTPASPCVTP